MSVSILQHLQLLCQNNDIMPLFDIETQEQGIADIDIIE